MDIDDDHTNVCRKRKPDSECRQCHCKSSEPEAANPSCSVVLCNRETLQFMYRSSEGWKSYSDELSAIIRISFAAHEKFAKFSVSGHSFVVSFPHMMQLNLLTGYIRSIAWVDSSGKLITPARCLDGRSPY
ncbi:hypothetical protein KP509_17G047500 [Ceratopteris richardii]|uniref:WWE domain-containing protein n=1 Tax=Ceratopteris richardii TaxID=49495 RepID=A0A8T2SXZ9_CERRI|nr:hypothetical protein KP509_17G047500 [Ceratopteris richardii]